MATPHVIEVTFSQNAYKKIKHLIPDYWHVERKVIVHYCTDCRGENEDLNKAYHELLDSNVDMTWESGSPYPYSCTLQNGVEVNGHVMNGFRIENGKSVVESETILINKRMI